MRVFKLPNAAASQLAVTGTATTLFSLIATAAGSAPALPLSLNDVFLTPEDGDIRVTFDGNDPTATQGFLVRGAQVRDFCGFPLSKMKLIATSGTVAVSIVIGEDDVDSQE